MSRKKRFKHAAKKEAKLEKLALAGIATVTVGMVGTTLVHADDAVPAPSAGLVDGPKADAAELPAENPASPVSADSERPASEPADAASPATPSSETNQPMEPVSEPSQPATSEKSGEVSSDESQPKVTQIKPEITLTNKEIVENALQFSVYYWSYAKGTEEDEYKDLITTETLTILPGQTLTITPRKFEGYTALDGAKTVSYEEIKAGRHYYSSGHYHYSVDFKYHQNSAVQPEVQDDLEVTVYYQFNHQNLANPTKHMIKKGKEFEIVAPPIKGYVFRGDYNNQIWRGSFDQEKIRDVVLNYQLDIDSSRFISTKTTNTIPPVGYPAKAEQVVFATPTVTKLPEKDSPIHLNVTYKATGTEFYESRDYVLYPGQSLTLVPESFAGYIPISQSVTYTYDDLKKSNTTHKAVDFEYTPDKSYQKPAYDANKPLEVKILFKHNGVDIAEPVTYTITADKNLVLTAPLIEGYKVVSSADSSWAASFYEYGTRHLSHPQVWDKALREYTFEYNRVDGGDSAATEDPITIYHRIFDTVTGQQVDSSLVRKPSELLYKGSLYLNRNILRNRGYKFTSAKIDGKQISGDSISYEELLKYGKQVIVDHYITHDEDHYSLQFEDEVGNILYRQINKITPNQVATVKKAEVAGYKIVDAYHTASSLPDNQELKKEKITSYLSNYTYNDLATKFPILPPGAFSPLDYNRIVFVLKKQDKETPVTPSKPVDDNPSKPVNPETPAQSTETLTNSDKNVSVTLTGADVAAVDKIVADKVSDKDVLAKLPAEMPAKDVELYDVKTQKADGSFVQITGEATVTLPVDASRKVVKVIYFLPETGAVEELPFELSADGKSVRFKVTHFSNYGVVYQAKSSEQPVTPANPEQPVTPPKPTDSTQPTKPSDKPVTTIDNKLTISPIETADNKATIKPVVNSVRAHRNVPVGQAKNLPETGEKNVAVLTLAGVAAAISGFVGLLKKRKN
ncbi:LPXTG cell wall anchor domain-containing protein [Streptococcus sinensis]|uniref:LPXTG cell wall anchor domain-containing protein n=1 Tax=Streptococcus sinensis TaxID=176090 RepID=UPI001F41FFB4|nr:LPXTG cell wall anchor domain-containing protein [Streptococcus sinensis]MCF1283583.1 LPXTG cell wall anchor domain-containing protein [Streptococcus sinensis]